jgi:hypothetical protein
MEFYNISDIDCNLLQDPELEITCIYSDLGTEYCKNTCKFEDQLCDAHKMYKDNVNTYIEHEKLYTTDNIKSLLELTNQSGTNRAYKGANATKIFEILCDHKYVLYSHPRLMKTVLKKIVELKNDKDVFDSDKYKRVLFPHIIFENNNDYITSSIINYNNNTNNNNNNNNENNYYYEEELEVCI